MRSELASRKSSAQTQGITDTHWERLEATIGLDRPIYERYLAWMGGALTGDLGIAWSTAWGQNVLTIILSRLNYTLLLMVTAVLIALAFAIPFGIYSSVHPYSTGDLVITLFSFAGYSMPSFLVGLFLLILFSIVLNWLPYGGAGNLNLPGDIVNVLGRLITFGLTNEQVAGREVEIFADGIKHLILPAVTLAIFLAARWSRLMRGSLQDALHQDYIRTAAAKGARFWRIVLRHGLPNAVIPVITIMALDIPMLFTGSFMAEFVFSWPGIGRLYIDSFRYGDWPVLMGVIIFATYLIVFANLIADIAYGMVDPRIRHAR